MDIFSRPSLIEELVSRSPESNRTGLSKGSTRSAPLPGPFVFLTNRNGGGGGGDVSEKRT